MSVLCFSTFSFVAQASSALSPHSPQAHAISRLFIGVIILASAIALLVTGLVAWTMVRYRRRSGAAPAQVEGNRKVEILYTVIPLALMAGLFVCTVITMRQAEPATDAPPDLVIVAHQWWWEIRYPSANVVSANEIHLPAGVPMKLELRSADVIHELWIPDLAPKLDAVPGQKNRQILEGTTPGVYWGSCAEFCGACHAMMRIRVIVQSPEAFAEWERTQHHLPQPASELTTKGRDLVLGQSCMQCHTIEGTLAQGRVGPDLTHFASRGILASGAIDNTPENLRLWLADPQAVKPGCHMPNMKLTDSDIEQISLYLESLK